jgi:hypothetical protein
MLAGLYLAPALGLRAEKESCDHLRKKCCLLDKSATNVAQVHEGGK